MDTYPCHFPNKDLAEMQQTVYIVFLHQ